MFQCLNVVSQPFFCSNEHANHSLLSSVHVKFDGKFVVFDSDQYMWIKCLFTSLKNKEPFWSSSIGEKQTWYFLIDYSVKYMNKMSLIYLQKWSMFVSLSCKHILLQSISRNSFIKQYSKTLHASNYRYKNIFFLKSVVFWWNKPYNYEM